MPEKGQHDPQIRTAAAASALVAGGALAAATVVHAHTTQRRREKAETFRFGAEETPGEGVRRVARGQLDLTIRLLEDARRADDGGEAVHEARKALKRIRTLLRLTRGAFDEKGYRRENLILRDVGRALSGARDAQVLLDTLDALTSRYADGLRADAWSRLRVELATAATDSPAIGSVDASSLEDVLLDTRERVATWPLRGGGGADSPADGFGEVYRRGRRALRVARSEPSPESLHELRKRAKDLWHAAQLLKPICADSMSELGRDSHRLSDMLGEDHDLTILREHASQRPDLLTPVELELLLALIDHRQQALRFEAMQCAAALYREKPKKLLSRLALA